MKTSELIRQLQEADPSGELECCVGNADIHYVTVEPAYYDGCLQVLERDESSEYYNIIGARRVDTGDKVVINPLSISDAIFNKPEMPIRYDGLSSEQRRERYRASDEGQRRECHDIEYKIEEEHFVRWVGERAGLPSARGETNALHMARLPERLKRLARGFHMRHYGTSAAMPADLNVWVEKDGHKYLPSWNERREMQWAREVVVEVEGESVSLRRAQGTPA